MTPNCLGELILNSSPAIVYMSSVKVLILTVSSSSNSLSVSVLTLNPSYSIEAKPLLAEVQYYYIGLPSHLYYFFFEHFF